MRGLGFMIALLWSGFAVGQLPEFDSLACFKIDFVKNYDEEPLYFPDSGMVYIDKYREKLHQQFIYGERTVRSSYEACIDSLKFLGFKQLPADPEEVKLLFRPVVIIYDWEFPWMEGEILEIDFCDDVYRDLLIFYKNQTPVGLLKICFFCEDHIAHGFETDFTLYDELKDLLHK